ncbi:MAG: ATP-binding cassette domain-containing protein [Planctomycetota bacterium]|nr:ATP-binding cassette domain-containing protein [Planctomycetota bacterium]
MSWQLSIQLSLGDFQLDVKMDGNATPVALIGPNGSGKTTLLRTIAGAHYPDSGSIEVGGRVLFDSAKGVHLAPEERRVGYVPQGYGLFPHLRVADNVAFGTRTQPQLSRQARRNVALETLEQLGAVHLADRWPATLSGGEKQTVALARTLVIDPQLLLLDEPLAALDAAARRSLRTHLALHLADRKIPSIVITHDVRDVRALAATVNVIEKGKIIQNGSADELAAQPVSDFVAEFFHTEVQGSSSTC